MPKSKNDNIILCHCFQSISGGVCIYLSLHVGGSSNIMETKTKILQEQSVFNRLANPVLLLHLTCSVGV